jgi:hypothetical protein
MSHTLKNRNDGGEDQHFKGRLLAKFALAVLVTSLAITWSWSTIAVELFHAPDLGFTDAIAGTLALTGLFYGCGLGFRLGRDREHC